MVIFLTMCIAIFIIWSVFSFCVTADYGPWFIKIDNINDLFINICILYWKIIMYVVCFGFVTVVVFSLSSAIACGILEDTKYSDCKICNFWEDE